MRLESASRMPCAAVGSVLNSRTMALTAAWTWAGEPRPAVCSQRGGIGQQDRESLVDHRLQRGGGAGQQGLERGDGVREADVAARDQRIDLVQHRRLKRRVAGGGHVGQHDDGDVGVQRRRHGRIDERDGRADVERPMRDHRRDVGACNCPQRRRRRRPGPRSWVAASLAVMAPSSTQDNSVAVAAAAVSAEPSAATCARTNSPCAPVSAPAVTAALERGNARGRVGIHVGRDLRQEVARPCGESRWRRQRAGRSLRLASARLPRRRRRSRRWPRPAESAIQNTMALNSRPAATWSSTVPAPANPATMAMAASASRSRPRTRSVTMPQGEPGGNCVGVRQRGADDRERGRLQGGQRGSGLDEGGDREPRHRRRPAEEPHRGRRQWPRPTGRDRGSGWRWLRTRRRRDRHCSPR